ncbi:testis-expressed protein 10 like protein [Ditylenchus destructor]|nr:testis-expressed protein 10 like protein [Ditylenchus destructor]
MKKSKNKNSKKSGPAVQQYATFGKKKIKIGRVLKRDNVTDSTVNTKSVVLLEQLKESTSKIVSHRGLSLEDLCKQLSHYNDNVRRNAIMGTKQLLEANPDQIPKNMRTIIPAIGSQISAGMKHSATRGQLKVLIKLVCNVSSNVISSYFDLLLTHVLKGLSDVNYDIRFFAFDVLIILMERYPDLCAKKAELFKGYLLLMESQRRPTKPFNILKSIHLFLTIFGSRSQVPYWSPHNIDVLIKNRTCSPAAQIFPSRRVFDFPVLYSSTQSTEKSLMLTEEGLLRTCRIISVLLPSLCTGQPCQDQASVVAEARSSFNKLRKIIGKYVEENKPAASFTTKLDRINQLLAKSLNIT